MALRLPPLSSLRLFEAAGRHLSFRSAAAELNLTPSAVSHGILTLEASLGTDLFIRRSGKLSLSPAGSDYLPYVTEALQLVAVGTARLPKRNTVRTIAISCAPTFAIKLLVPRLDELRVKFGEIDVKLDTSRRHVEFPRDGFDFAIRMSPEQQSNGDWVKLFSEQLVPVCSPAYFASNLDKDGIFNVRSATLLHVSPASEDWLAWGQRHCLDIDTSRGLHFDTIQLAVDAAKAGAGVALGRRPLINVEIADGYLIETGLKLMEANTSYWLVSSAESDSLPHLSFFKRWLIEMAIQFERQSMSETSHVRESAA